MDTRISKALSALADAYDHATTQTERDAIRRRIAATSYKEEADREGSRRRDTERGRFNAAMLSLDNLVDSFDDPSKIAALSDNGRGADALVDAAGWRAASRAAALKRLGKADRDFVLAVFRGATWRELGTTRQGFNKRIRKISENFGFHPPPEKPSLKT